MKTIHLTMLTGLVMSLILIAGCSPRINQPAPLTELDGEPDWGENTFAEDDFFVDGPVGDDAQNSNLLDDNWDDDFSDFEGDTAVTERPYSGEWFKDPNMETVYFDYDAYDLSADAQRALYNNAQYLRTNDNLRVLIEGHCDERGTDQYNQALGENRALAVREYLIQLGIAANRIDILSYGELRPAVQGTDESSFRWNRRAEFKVVG